jgi:hypothetical protein
MTFALSIVLVFIGNYFTSVKEDHMCIFVTTFVRFPLSVPFKTLVPGAVFSVISLYLTFS